MTRREKRLVVNALTRLADSLREVRGFHVAVDAPEDANGEWFLDVRKGKRAVSVQWRRGFGFGISAERGPGFGEGPHEVVSGIATAQHRLVALLNSGEQTRPPEPLPFASLRMFRGVSQGQLAARLGVQQAAISRQEQRREVMIGSLRSFVEALDGSLRILVSFPDGVSRVLTFGPKGKR